MIGFKATREFKDFLKKIAKQENRTLSNFIVNALLVYIKVLMRDKHGGKAMQVLRTTVFFHLKLTQLIQM